MSEIGVYRAKTHLPSLLERVSQGERFTITKHGVPIAELIPAGKSPKKPLPEVAEEILRRRRKRKMTWLEFKMAKEWGRR